MNRSSNIAIIGGGAACVSVLAHLAAADRGDCRVTVFDSSADHGLGVAYATRDPAHLLNVPARGMGIWADPARAGDFLDWLNTDPSWRGLDSSFAAVEVEPYAFMPRMVYGAYLQSIRDRAMAAMNGRVRFVRAHVTDIRPDDAGLRVVTDADAGRFDAVVLACGNVAPVRVAGMDDAALPVYGLRSNDVPDRLRDADRIIIAGTGLSMVDAVLTLDRIGFAGTITAVSRHGLMPRPHADEFVTPQPPGWTHGEWPRDAAALARCIRRDADAAVSSGGDWRAVIDGLRGVSNPVWLGLSDRARRVLRRALPYWAVHRHRMAPDVSKRMEGLMKTGVLRIRHGRVESVGAGVNGGVRVMVNGVAHDADAMFCALGYRSDPCAAGTLTAKLVNDGVLRAAGGGVVLHDLATLRIGAPHKIYGLGPVLGASLIETTAMPDIRQQAGMIAAAILQHAA